MSTDLGHLRCVVFDYGFTLSSDLYFQHGPPAFPGWRELVEREIFARKDIVDAWMNGALRLDDLAAMLAPSAGIPPGDVLLHLRRGAASAWASTRPCCALPGGCGPRP